MLQRPRGTRDFLPDEMERRRAVEAALRERVARWGYREVCTPEFEELELFTIRSGAGIIGEIYAFEDKGGRKMALRPEITAPVLRMFVNEAKVLPKPLRWFYFADCFRYERPQKGRYRQFWQFGVELIGADTPGADAECILLADDLLRAAGVPSDIHVGHLAPMKHLLAGLGHDEQAKAMAFLDKRDFDGLAGFMAGIGKPELEGRLRDLAHARSLEELFAVTGEIPEKDRITKTIGILDRAGLAYTLDFGIARGLDYYTGTVFEGFAPNLGAENQVLGGGAYRLAHLFGGDDVPSCGFAIGFDRLMVSLGETKLPRPVRVAVCSTEEGRLRAFEVARAFRDAGICAEPDLLDRNLGAQMAHAAKSADYAVIVGKREVETGTVTLKDLGSGGQKAVPLPDAVAEVAARVPR
ncbi:MAG TPA: histidine--tRNA ligase [Methanomicrobiales archaeon]|nr:histidine--tRNA ligase [Methanomicrobiales archaeon]